MKVQRTRIAMAVAMALTGVMLPAHAQQADSKPADAAQNSTPAPAIAVSADKTVPVQEVTVTGIRASRQQSLSKKRDADSVMDVVTAEDIGKLPDKNVADAVQRVPGVNISSGSGGEGGFSENDRVSIRGTNPSLTQTTVNGHSIATGYGRLCLRRFLLGFVLSHGRVRVRGFTAASGWSPSGACRR